VTDIALPPLLKASGAVTAIIGSNPMRCYPAGIAAQNGSFDQNVPLVTWFTVFTIPQNYLNGAPTMDYVRLQVNAWATDFNGALALFNACRSACELSGTWVDVNQDGFDDDVKRFYVLGHIEFWVHR
jgi:hypothetical protein